MSFKSTTPKKEECIMPMKCITFDKGAQDALPEDIKEKMKADREKARKALDAEKALGKEVEDE